ncbi:GvpL/GvpF family gas vesicle protein [Flexibacterium corallicola]|uniref:GvpL/GvpF family gas vesicle protein n=1 Tax=Flexibacterium corallicola TaxID=3037259 RepID=UPI00286EE349|nr:GvpL/GvpF family gas vesicle protein [Pseudovibrio sp. M1P-2-3]
MIKSEPSDFSEALYIYAVIPQSAAEGVRRIMPQELQLISQQSFTAICRRAADVQMASLNRQDLSRQLLAHQQTVEAIMPVTPILPVKFGSVAPDRASIERVLENGAPEFLRAFEQLAGKTQFEVLVMWNLEEVLADLSQSPEVTALKSSGLGAVELGVAVKDLIDARREALAEQLSQALRGVSFDTISNVLMDDRMVLNLATLIDKDRTGELDTCLEMLDTVTGGALNFRCVGPLPPFSFATVEVNFLDPSKVLWAHGVLGLAEGAISAEVRAAYHRLAKQMHPDTGATTQENDQMSELQDAYKTLCAFTESGGPVQVSVCRLELGVPGGAE